MNCETLVMAIIKHCKFKTPWCNWTDSKLQSETNTRIDSKLLSTFSKSYLSPNHGINLDVWLKRTYCFKKKYHLLYKFPVESQRSFTDEYFRSISVTCLQNFRVLSLRHLSTPCYVDGIPLKIRLGNMTTLNITN